LQRPVGWRGVRLLPTYRSPRLGKLILNKNNGDSVKNVKTTRQEAAHEQRAEATPLEKTGAAFNPQPLCLPNFNGDGGEEKKGNIELSHLKGAHSGKRREGTETHERGVRLKGGFGGTGTTNLSLGPKPLPKKNIKGDQWRV